MLRGNNEYSGVDHTLVHALIHNNLLWHVVFLVCAMILTDFEVPILHNILTLFLLQLGSYAGHYVSHMRLPVIRWVDVHMFFHHGSAKANRGLLQDFLTEVVAPLTLTAALVVAPVVWLGLTHYFPPIVIFLGTITYTSFHFVNYTMFESKTHAAHHAHLNCNYGPDWLDHVFGTSCDGTVENTNAVAINAVVVAVVLLVLKKMIL